MDNIILLDLDGVMITTKPWESDFILADDFAEFNPRATPQQPLKTYIFEETFRPGWRLNSYRFGKSQNWAEMKHPEGFTVEIYLTNLLDLIHLNTIKNGELIGNFKWESNKLIKE